MDKKSLAGRRDGSSLVAVSESADLNPKTLKPGDPRHYTSYVGPPTQFDFMGATQFSLLFALGLRARHRVLDFGCGSLRAGRLLIPYLERGNYFGVEPNQWLLDEAITNEVGRDLIAIKEPTFDNNDQFRADCFGVLFDFIVAQSIFSHTGPDAVVDTLRSFRSTLESDGLIVATFVEGDEDYDRGARWEYPESITYTPPTINKFATDADLAIVRTPWFHPRQTWYLMAKYPARLPTDHMLRLLHGAVLFDPDFSASIPT